LRAIRRRVVVFIAHYRFLGSHRPQKQTIQ